MGKFILNIDLDDRLKKDSILLGCSDCSYLLLMRNSVFPWFVLVPDTKEIELHRLSSELQLRLLKQINLVSKYIEDNYKTDKINIGLIGNIVSQMHVHIIGRNRDDICWPGVAWGVSEFKQYEPMQIEGIKENIKITFKDVFTINE
jgi:diadenosine tetraphosphate (Ap4A) HIT family hydrolase